MTLSLDLSPSFDEVDADPTHPEVRGVIGRY